MPFVSVAQEEYMKINLPDLWKKWISKYGHAPGYKRRKSSTARKRKNRRKK